MNWMRTISFCLDQTKGIHFCKNSVLFFFFFFFFRSRSNGELEKVVCYGSSYDHSLGTSYDNQESILTGLPMSVSFADVIETEEDRFLSDLYAVLKDCEAYAEELAKNLLAQSRGERQLHPGMSVELLQQEIGALRRRLAQAEEDRCFTTNNFYRLHDCLSLGLLVVEKRCNILQNEREAMMLKAVSPTSNYVYGMLVRQPRSQSMKRSGRKSNQAALAKGKRYEINFILGALTSFVPDRASLAVSLTQLEQPGRGKVAPALSVGVSKPEWQENGEYVRCQLVFPEGTQVMPSAVMFRLTGEVKIAVGNGQVLTAPVKMTACNSLPIVVCTNENQWEQAECRIVRRQVFERSPNSKAPWNLMCNWLREFFMRATRQDLLESSLATPSNLAILPPLLRGLSDKDLEHFHKTWFGGASSVGESEFSVFFEWFGPACHHLRHNSLTRNLFVKGLIFGFVDKSECERLLSGKPDGYFLL
jgi:hypothetical protein